MRIALMGLALAMATGAAHSEESTLTHQAEYRVRHQTSMAPGFKKDASTRHDFMQRFKLGLTFKASETLSGQLTLLHAANLGRETYSADKSQTATVTGDTLHDAAITVYEAYGNWMVNDSTMIRFGRTSVPVETVSLSSNDWEQRPSSFEGAIINHEQESFKIMGYGVVFADNMVGAKQNIDGVTTAPANPNGKTDPQVNVYGLGFGWKALPDFLKHATLSFAHSTGHPLVGNVEIAGKTSRYTVSLGGDAAGLDYGLTYIMHSGKNKWTPNGTGSSGGTITEEDTEGSMIHGTLGYSLPDLMDSRFGIVYHQDSGNKGDDSKKEIFDAFFYNKHENAGLMDIVRWGNLTHIGAGYTFSPMEGTKLGLHYHMFDRTEDTSAPVLTGSIAGTGNKSDIGSEIDVVATQDYGNGLQLEARYGVFSPGGYLKDNGLKDDYSLAFLQAKMNF